MLHPGRGSKTNREVQILAFNETWGIFAITSINLIFKHLTVLNNSNTWACLYSYERKKKTKNTHTHLFPCASLIFHLSELSYYSETNTTILAMASCLFLNHVNCTYNFEKCNVSFLFFETKWCFFEREKKWSSSLIKLLKCNQGCTLR